MSLVLTLVVLLLAKFLLASKHLVLGASLVIFFWLGCLNTTLHLPENDEKHLIHYDFKQTEINAIRAEVVDVLNENQFNYKYLLKDLRINSTHYNGKVLLHVGKSSKNDPPEVGDHIHFFANLRAIKPSKNPQDFNYADYLKIKDVYAQIYESSYVTIPHNTKSIHAVAFSLRSKIVKNLEESGFEEKHLQLLQALILGQKQNIDEQMYSQFADVGIVHILAVSGLHVGLVFLILNALLKTLKILNRFNWLRVLLIVLLLWSFAFVVGFSPSVVRAVTMFSCFALSDLFKRRTNSINVLLLSALVLLLVNPTMLFEVGFQLSYAAVFSIVCLYPVFSKLYYPKYKLTKLFTDTAFVSLAAQLGVLPFQLLYFHQFPTLFLLANIVVIPFLGVLISGGLICVLLSALDLLWYPILWAYSSLLNGLIMYVDWLSKLKGFVLKDIYFTKPMAVVLVLLVFAFIVMFRQYKRSSILLFLIVGASFVLVVARENLNIKKTSELVIFHRHRSSLIGIKSKSELHVYSSDSTLDVNTYTIKNYKLMNAVDTVKMHHMQNEYFIENTRFSVIDSFGIYRDSPEKRVVVLSHSPDIHFEKLLKSQNISEIIADGSNYKSYVERWKNTAEQYNVPFHSTYQKGYYQLKQ